MATTLSVLEKLTRAINELILTVGYWKFLIPIILFFALLIIRRIYSDHRKDKETKELLKEKDRTIQRIAKEAREWKIVYFKEVKNWSDDQIQKFFIKNDFENGEDARRYMEGDDEQL